MSISARLRDIPDRMRARKLDHGPWSLQRKLVVAFVAIFGIVAVFIGALSVAVLSVSLTSRLDTQLAQAARSAQDGSFRSNDPFSLLPGQGAGVLVGVVQGDESVAFVKGQDGAPQQIDADLTDATPAAGAVTVDAGDYGDYRVQAIASGPISVVVGLPMKEVNTTLLQLGLIIGSITALGLLFATVAGRYIVRRTLRPLEEVAGTATRVSEMQLAQGSVDIDERVPVDDPRTEVGSVGASLNRLLDHVSGALSAREKSERKVRQFVADASHELRTPLAAIRGYSELTRRSGHRLPDDIRHSLSRIESESVRMTSLVEDLLLLARLDEGRELTTDAVDVTQLVADAVSDARAAGPDHEWSAEIPDAAVTVAADPARLHQVVANLLANARVHTPAGTHVRASVTVDEARVRIEVTDDGPGIPEEIRATLFERFVRADVSRSRIAGSTGLGLSIVQAIVTGHGGEVSVVSEVGAGSTFRIELPLHATVDADDRDPEAATV
jgi:two-component system, OmpR family, sensor kinase